MFWGEEDVLKLDRGGGCIHCECTRCHWIVHCKMVNCMICEFHLCREKAKNQDKTSTNTHKTSKSHISKAMASQNSRPFAYKTEQKTEG